VSQEEKVEEIKHRARNNFSLGFNFAERVFEAFIHLLDTGSRKEGKKQAPALPCGE
jgi:hypothetical protein